MNFFFCFKLHLILTVQVYIFIYLQHRIKNVCYKYNNNKTKSKVTHLYKTRLTLFMHVLCMSLNANRKERSHFDVKGVHWIFCMPKDLGVCCYMRARLAVMSVCKH